VNIRIGYADSEFLKQAFLNFAECAFPAQPSCLRCLLISGDSSDRGWSVLDPMQPDAYGMFLVHYPIVLWSQWLFDFDISAIGKGVVAFVLAVVLTWTATEALRKIPGATRVLLLELAGTTYATVIT
jgi:hypothetical protein